MSNPSTPIRSSSNAAHPSTPASSSTTSSPAPPPAQLSEEDAAQIAKEAKLTPEQKQKREEVRVQVISEIQSTERSYVQALDALVQCFVLPLKEKAQTEKGFKDISGVFVEYMCSNLETLTNFHHSFIESLMQIKTIPATPANLAAPDESSSSNPSSVAALPVTPTASSSPTTPASELNLPAVFLRFSNFFKLYIPYLNGYENSLKAFNSLRTHKKFQEWLHGDLKTNLKAHATKNGTSELDLLSYMIQPVQRVPRYVLLLKELKRQTSPYHPEFQALNEALLKVQHVASIINEGQRAVENANKLMTIQNRIIGEFESLIQPHRRLIREGVVNATYTYGMFNTVRTRKSVFFLFSDIILWTSEAFKFKGQIDLTPAKLTPKNSTTFVIDTANKALQASWDSEEETKSWFESIDAVVAALQNERDKLRQRRVQKARQSGGGTLEKDAVHKLVTQSLQGLQLANEANAANANANGSEAASTDATNGSSRPSSGGTVHSVAAVGGSVHPASSGPSMVGTVGRASTFGQRAGRKWEETLEAGEAKLRKEQENLAAFSREKLGENTFAPPEDAATTTGEYGEHASSSASPPPSNTSTSTTTTNPTSSHATTTAPVVGGDKKYVARFVSRRGRGTLTKADACMCTTILVHRDCPQHGEQAMKEQQSLLEPEQQ